MHTRRRIFSEWWKLHGRFGPGWTNGFYFFFGRKILTWLLGARMFGRYSNVRRVGNLGVFIFSSALVLSSITGNHRMNDELGSFSAEEK